MMVSAVIPAYNEEHTIGNVVKTLKSAADVTEIIVVSDGSSDRTAVVARECGAKVLVLPKNMGKGAAIKAGVEICSGDVILLLDADLVGLNPMHVKSLIEPVINDKCDMTIGIFCSGRFSTDFAQRITPSLSGQRALKKSILEKLPITNYTGYAIEVMLTEYCRRNNIRMQEVELGKLTHVTKEEKFGFACGFIKRIKMYLQIYKIMRMMKNNLVN